MIEPKVTRSLSRSGRTAAEQVAEPAELGGEGLQERGLVERAEQPGTLTPAAWRTAVIGPSDRFRLGHGRRTRVGVGDVGPT